MNPHNHPPKIKSVAMDQLPTPRTEEVIAKGHADDVAAHRDDLEHYMHSTGRLAQHARTLERELLATQACERVLRSALEDTAKQKLPIEMYDEEAENADYESGYCSIVELARAALDQLKL